MAIRKIAARKALPRIRKIRFHDDEKALTKALGELKKALISGFKRNRDVKFDDYSEIEKSRAKELVKERFGNDLWTFRL